MPRAPGSATLALALSLAMAAAPLAGAVETSCHVCPPTCPMHLKAEKAQRLPCHVASAEADTAGDRSAPCDGAQPGFTRPGCGQGHTTPATALPEAVLPRPAVISSAPPISAIARRAAPIHARGAERPETPPPIASC